MYRIGSTTIEAIDTYVRITVRNKGGIDAKPIVKCTKKQCPTSEQVAELLTSIKGYRPDSAHLTLCSRASHDAKLNANAVDL